MKIAIITTVNHNVGDDFVREGIIYLLRQKFGEISVSNIHKHAPVTVRRGFDWVRSFHLSRSLDLLPLFLTEDKILSSNLLVQSGAPVYWCHDFINSHCADNEWYGPLIKRRYSKIRNKVKFINIAGGTCQRYYSDCSEIKNCVKCSSYIKELFNFSDVTTVRDSLAQSLLHSLDIEAPLMPCASIFACDELKVAPAKPEYICLNYMHGAGHYDFGQGIDAKRWETVFKEFYNKIREQERCVFVCHNYNELKETKKIAHPDEIFFSRDYRDYIKFYSKSKFGIMNRVHGAFAIASFGRPSFIIGTDTRARMSEEIGLKHEFIDKVDLARLLEEYEFLKAGADNYEERFRVIKKKALYDYHNALSVL